MALVVNFTDHRPSARHDDVPWSKVRVVETDDPSNALDTWDTVNTIDLTHPEATFHSFTVAAEEKWLRPIFLDEDDNEDQPGPLVYANGPNYRPTLQEISAALRTRTYVGDSDVDRPTGAQAGVFGANTRPTSTQVENELIPLALPGLAAIVGDNAPGFLIEKARRVATLKVATEIERSYLPEQGEADASNYQTLRMTSETEAADLGRSVQWWVLASR